jgi:DNA mismatch endonuclease (patch repair protein)
LAKKVPMSRSEMMSRIGSKDTAPELILRKGLHARGLRFRLHRKDLPGRPDIVLPRYNTALFIHGCFWHAHEDCRYFRLPATRMEFWSKKLMGNRIRDNQARTKLLQLGWRVLTVWECATRAVSADVLSERVIGWLRSDALNGDISERMLENN